MLTQRPAAAAASAEARSFFLCGLFSVWIFANQSSLETFLAITFDLGQVVPEALAQVSVAGVAVLFRAMRRNHESRPVATTYGPMAS